jgi:integrase
MHPELPAFRLWYRADLKTYYVRYRNRVGHMRRLSLGTGNEAEANRRAPGVIAKDLRRGRGPVELVHIEDLFPLVRQDYQLNERRSIGKLDYNIKRLKGELGDYRIGQFSTADVLRYVDHRKREGAANGTINRELAVLKRAFALAIGIANLSRDHAPVIPTLKEAAPRAGFFEPEQFQAVLHRLRPEIQPVALFAYETGWRLREVLRLERRNLDLREGSARLDPGTTKNNAGRVAYLSPHLLSTLQDQETVTRTLERKNELIIPWVFHRKGRRILRFLASWQTACRNAGVPGMFFHDLRRTAVRNMVRAGIPERVAMQISGHKTRAVFERYNIVSDGDLREAATRLAAHTNRRADSHPSVVAAPVASEAAHERCKL